MFIIRTATEEPLQRPRSINNRPLQELKWRPTWISAWKHLVAGLTPTGLTIFESTKAKVTKNKPWSFGSIQGELK